MTKQEEKQGRGDAGHGSPLKMAGVRSSCPKRSRSPAVPQMCFRNDRGHLKFKINSNYRDSGKRAKINTNTVSHSSWQVTLPTNAPTCAPPSAIFWLTQLFLCSMTLAAADYTSSRFSTAILVPLGLFLKNENVALACFLHQ